MEITAPITLTPLTITAPITVGYGFAPTIYLNAPPVNGVNGTSGVLGQFAAVNGTVQYQCVDVSPMTWQTISGGGGGGVIFSATAPLNPSDGQQWFNTVTGIQAAYWLSQGIWVANVGSFGDVPPTAFLSPSGSPYTSPLGAYYTAA